MISPRGGLRDRVAIVTGGGWHHGRSVAERLAAAGTKVVVAARRAELLAATVEAIQSGGGEALAVPTDATDPGAVDALVRTTVEHFGGVDILAALAGGGYVPRELEAVTPAHYREVFDNNVFSAFLCARAVMPQLRERDAGSILFCAGGGAFVPEVGAPHNVYAAAKAAICRFTDQLTAELWQTGIRVNCMDPGSEPAAAAELATWLLSDDSAPLRGRCVAVADDWWRDPERVAAVDATVHAYRLRRAEL